MGCASTEISAVTQPSPYHPDSFSIRFLMSCLGCFVSFLMLSLLTLLISERQAKYIGLASQPGGSPIPRALRFSDETLWQRGKFFLHFDNDRLNLNVSVNSFVRDSVRDTTKSTQPC